MRTRELCRVGKRYWSTRTCDWRQAAFGGRLAAMFTASG